VRADVLVLALGNPLLGDEGVGPRALSELAREHRFPASVELVDGGTAGLSLVPKLSEARKAIVVDAIRTGQPPGTLVELDGAKLPRRFFGSLSPHQVGFRDIVSASRLMGGPEEIVLLGIEPLTTKLAAELSEPVARSLDALVNAVLVRLEAWGVTAERCG
jgi:hydrogenase maturation protease